MQVGPKLLLVGKDQGLIFRQSQAETREAVHVAIGDVVHGLPHGPTAGAVWGVQLRFVEPGDGLAEMRGSGGDVCNQARPVLWRDRLLEIEFPDWVAQIHVPNFTSSGRK